MKILLVSDLQPYNKDANGHYEKCLSYIEKHREEYDKIVATNFKNDKVLNSNFYRYLDYKENEDFDIKDLEFKADINIIKYGYTTYPENLFSEKDEIFLIGCNAETSILATAFSLWDADFKFHILSDYIFSQDEVMRFETIILLKKLFGKAVEDSKENNFLKKFHSFISKTYNIIYK